MLCTLNYWLFSSTLPFLGDISNPSNNAENVFDSAFFNFTVAVPANSSGTSFFVVALLTFDNMVEIVELRAFTQEYFVVVPTIVACTGVSKT